MHLDAKLPLLVFGGPYSNLRALNALHQCAGKLGIPPSQTICTGDVVAYCAEPEETTAAIRDWGCHVIAGNCEEQLAAAAADCACGFELGTECDTLAKGWYPFANARMSAESRGWMAALPKTITFSAGGLTFRVIHGGVDVINRFVFASQRDVLAEENERADADVSSAATPACRSSSETAAACGSIPASSACRPTTARPMSGTASSARGRAASRSRRTGSPTIITAPPLPCAAAATPTAMPARW